MIQVVQQVTVGSWGWSVYSREILPFTALCKNKLACESQDTTEVFIRGWKEAEKVGGEEAGGSYHY